MTITTHAGDAGSPRSERIAYYRDCSAGVPVWCYHLTVDGEHDHSDPVDDVDGSDSAESVAEALAARWHAAEIRRVSDVRPDPVVIGRRLRQLRAASERQWEMAADTCYVGQTDEIDTDRAAECADAAESALASWDAAIEAAELGRFDDAIDALEEAESLASDWGDSSQEAEALLGLALLAEAMLRAAEGCAR